MAFWGKLKNRLKGVRERWSGGIVTLFSSGTLTEEFWEELEEMLIAGDVGLELTDELTKNLQEYASKHGIRQAQDLKEEFSRLLETRLTEVPRMGDPVRPSSSPSIVLLVGVNGSGKTTTSAKLAAGFKAEGKKVILAAADTYRPAAIDQLRAWGETIGVRVVAQAPGSDPAAVVFDAIQSARASGADLVIADSAGRLHTKHNLMEELKKLKRVISRELPGQPEEVLLVLDAVMGQNGFRQVEAFHEALGLTGVILTKYDNTAKGGVILAVADRLKLPIRYVGLGEGIGDLGPFEAASFVEGLLTNNGEITEEEEANNPAQ